MSAEDGKNLRWDEVMRNLLLMAEAELHDERRSETRIPFFRPASVRVGRQSFSVFIRDISESSMGLLHNMELPLHEVVVKLAGQPHILCVQIARCAPIGEGWYVSGGKIVGVGA